jgi:hypothetical protein
MPQSLSSLLIHLIFSTKDRYPFLAQNDLLRRTHAYLGGILREFDCPSLQSVVRPITFTPSSDYRVPNKWQR